MAITITSTSDSQEEVNLAAGLTADGKDPGEVTTDAADGAAAGPKADSSPEARNDNTGGTGASATRPAQAQPGEQPSAATASPDSDGKKKGGGFQRKIDRLERERDDLLQRVSRLEGAAAAGGRKPNAEGGGATRTNQTAPKPTPKDAKYKTSASPYEDYIEDLANWTADRRFEARMKEAGDNQQREVQQEELKQIHDSHFSRVKEFSKANPDRFDAAIETLKDENLTVPQSAQLAIFESDIGPEVICHLAENPGLVDELWQMTPVRQVGAIERLASSVEAGKAITTFAKGAAGEKSSGTDAGKKGKDNTAEGGGATRVSKAAGAAVGAGTSSAGAAAGTQPVRRAVSQAGAPITPIAGGPGRTVKPLSELSGKDYRAARRAGRST